jgi:1,4-alpha-glucan branching enzyme/maltooligosyltrehalose trehalohydrolase
MPFGAHLLEGRRGAEFSLWAPSAAGAAVVLQSHDSELVLPGVGEPGGWYRVQADVHAGQRYVWQLDGGQRMPDPASRFNPQGPAGSSELVDAIEFEWDNEWRGRPWHEAAVYELHLGCFTPAGTLAMAELQLHSLAQLGLTAIQLMPVAAWSGSFGWGYEVQLPFAPHAPYGTPQDLKRFIQAAHRLKMMVFVDLAGLHVPSPADAGALEFCLHNALYWIEEFRVDGLRLGDLPAEVVQALSQRVGESFAGRHVHLMLDAQCNRDFHDAMHELLTGDADEPMERLARALIGGARLNFLHRHDTIARRPFGERLTTLANAPALRLATAVCLLGVAAPMVFMGDEFASTAPFMYFEDLQGPAREAARRKRLAEGTLSAREAQAAARGELPDPFSEATFRRCKLDRASAHSATHREWRRWFNEVLALRQRDLAPHLGHLCDHGHQWWRIGGRAFGVRWLFDDGRVLELVANVGRLPVRFDRRQGPPPLSQPSLLYSVGEVIDDSIAGHSAAWHWGQS